MTNTNEGNVVSEIYPESEEAIDYLLRGRRVQAEAQNGNGERKPVLTRDRKIALGGLAGIVSAAALGFGTLGMIPCALGGLYVGAVGIKDSIENTLKAGWAVTKGLGKGALMVASRYSEDREEASLNGTEKTAAKNERYGTNEDREYFARLDAGALRENKRLDVRNFFDNYFKQAMREKVTKETNKRLENINVFSEDEAKDSVADYEGVGRLAEEQRDWYNQNENPSRIALRPAKNALRIAKENEFNQRAADAAYAHKMYVLEEKWGNK